LIRSSVDMPAGPVIGTAAHDLMGRVGGPRAGQPR
jgi:hypothetical protein